MVFSDTYPKSWVAEYARLEAARAAEEISYKEMRAGIRKLEAQRASAEAALTKAERVALLQRCETPPDFWAAVQAVYGFQVDVCASKVNTKCEVFFDEARDALDPGLRWLRESADPKGYARAWCNPGFADVYPWHLKAHAEATRCWGNVVVVIGLPGVEQAWARFAQLHADEIINLCPRVNYLMHYPLKQETNPRGCVMTVYRRKMDPETPARVLSWDWPGVVVDAA
jgi:hypothetical protein